MILNEISHYVSEGKTTQIADLVNRALKEEYPAEKILREGLVAGIMEAEKNLIINELPGPEIVFAERALNIGLEILNPLLNGSPDPPIGTVITGTPEGDIRETEKKIITVMMQSMGLRVIDLGTSIPVIRFIEAAIEEKARMIICTTSLVTFLPRMKLLVQAANQASLKGKTKILICGRPVTVWFSKSVNADMYSPNPVQTAEIALEYCKKVIK